MKNFLLVFSILFFASCNQAKHAHETMVSGEKEMTTSSNEEMSKMKKSKEEWKEQLTDHEYYVLREAGTERAFTGEYLSLIHI